MNIKQRRQRTTMSRSIFRLPPTLSVLALSCAKFSIYQKLSVNMREAVDILLCPRSIRPSGILAYVISYHSYCLKKSLSIKSILTLEILVMINIKFKRKYQYRPYIQCLHVQWFRLLHISVLSWDYIGFFWCI